MEETEDDLPLSSLVKIVDERIGSLPILEKFILSCEVNEEIQVPNLVQVSSLFMLVHIVFNFSLNSRLEIISLSDKYLDKAEERCKSFCI